MKPVSALRVPAVLGALGLTMAGLAAPAQAAPGGALAGAVSAPAAAAPESVTNGGISWTGTVPQGAPAGFETLANCRQHSHTAKDNTEGTVTKADTPLRLAGPYSDCPIVGYLQPGVRLVYHCYVLNDVGNTWTWVRKPGTETWGWVYDGNLANGGSYVRC
ncbi:hypothetical protein [Micromonospora matsumotoense]|uniref:hypothetical protein n=1 Tax=Micromonospora matsumotoense TaxID=121616 RepID=UPI0033E87B34